MEIILYWGIGRRPPKDDQMAHQYGDCAMWFHVVVEGACQSWAGLNICCTGGVSIWWLGECASNQKMV